MSRAFLILADGTVFEGESIGKEGVTLGETVFTTGMTGYIETLTDPSYFGQIITQTFPLMGNYGIIPQDYESKKIWASGYIVREICEQPSNFREDGTLNQFLKSQNITGICGIDTRALTKKLRDAGVMNGMIVSGETAIKEVLNMTSSSSSIKPDEKLLEKIRSYKIEHAVESVQNSSVLESSAEKSDENKKKIVLWDFGAKANIQRELEKRGCTVNVVPCDTTAEQILSLNPDGIMLSNGPGDPAENTAIISEIKKICDYNISALSQGSHTVPIFGICLGHQLLALARGCKTLKLKYGHRGGNHPVKDLETGRVFITSQNHGYAVDLDTLPAPAKKSFINVNDGTCEGLSYTDIPAFSVQFHPEACGGPHDTNFLFDRFFDSIS